MDKTNLTELTGTEKQISWANDLRAEFIGQYNGQKSAKFMAFLDLYEIGDALASANFGGQFGDENEAYESLRDYTTRTQTEAKWWIDARNDLGMQRQAIADWAKNL